ncbi:MAG: hypothetical protein JJE30_08910 [Desulfuromonadales bacterium]|nr:hypothetical protein [Desulfuromonadales bacterium]
MKKLNFDGRYAVLHPLESQSRFAKLTNNELEFLGRIMGWSVPYYRGVDWDTVPPAMLAEAIMHPDGVGLLQSLYPAPTGADQVNWEEVSEDELHLVATNKTTIKELQGKYPVSSQWAKK